MFATKSFQNNVPLRGIYLEFCLITTNKPRQLKKILDNKNFISEIDPKTTWKRTAVIFKEKSGPNEEREKAIV